MRFDRLVNFSPEDGGGQDVGQTQATGQTAQALPEHLLGFLKNKGIEIDPAQLDERTVKVIGALYEDRGRQIKEAETQRKRAQTAEAKIQDSGIEAILGTVDDSTRDKLRGIVDMTSKSKGTREALEMIADAGLPLTREMLDLADAGPAATRAALTHIGKAQQNGATQHPFETVTEQSINEMITKGFARLVGIGADQSQQQQDGTKPKESAIARYGRPRDSRDEMLDAFKKGVSGTKE